MIRKLTAILYGLTLSMSLMLGGARAASAGQLEDGFAAAQRRDYATALRLLEPLATQGQVQSQTLLGFMYMEGQGVPQDYQQAMKWLRLAANQGEASAEFALGDMYLNSKGVPYNKNEAMKWLSLAAVHGEARAQGLVGAIYRDMRDYGEAAKWLQLAANQGEVPAQRVLGEIYQNGQGLRRDYVEAYRWFSIAAAKGDADAAENQAAIEKQMTSKQLTEAKRRAVAWKPAIPVASTPGSQSSAKKATDPKTGPNTPIVDYTDLKSAILDGPAANGKIIQLTAAYRELGTSRGRPYIDVQVNSDTNLLFWHVDFDARFNDTVRSLRVGQRVSLACKIKELSTVSYCELIKLWAN